MASLTMFADWLQKLIDRKGLSRGEFAAKAGLDPAIISRVLNMERMPNNNSLIAIAGALGVPPKTVFQAAGILPSDPDVDDPSLDELIHTYRQMPPEAQEDLLALSRTMLDSHKKREKRNREPKTQPRPSRV